MRLFDKKLLHDHLTKAAMLFPDHLTVIAVLFRDCLAETAILFLDRLTKNTNSLKKKKKQKFAIWQKNAISVY